MVVWGLDHWNTLAYVETCCVDDKVPGTEVGEIDKERMRTDQQRHPMLVGFRMDRKVPVSQKYPTRLRGKAILEDHDDWDCLEDMEEAGLVEIISLVNGFVKMTEEGLAVAARIRAHKARGGSFANFEYAP